MRVLNLASDALKSRGVGIFQFQNLTEAEARRLAEQSLELERLCYADFQKPQIELGEFVEIHLLTRPSYWIGAAPEGPMYAYLLLEDHTDGDLGIEDFDELNLPREALELVEEAFEDAPKILYFRDICRLSRRDGLDRQNFCGCKHRSARGVQPPVPECPDRVNSLHRSGVSPRRRARKCCGAPCVLPLEQGDRSSRDFSDYSGRLLLARGWVWRCTCSLA